MRGQCLCGDVKFRIDGPTSQASACHCTRCRKWSGHYWTAAHVEQDHLVIEHGIESIAWYPEPNHGPERGFCLICGSSLFWRRPGENVTRVSFSLGAIDGQTHLTTEEHIFVGNKGDYYQIPDDAPHYEGDSE